MTRSCRMKTASRQTRKICASLPSPADAKGVPPCSAELLTVVGIDLDLDFNLDVVVEIVIVVVDYFRVFDLLHGPDRPRAPTSPREAATGGD